MFPTSRYVLPSARSIDCPIRTRCQLDDGARAGAGRHFSHPRSSLSRYVWRCALCWPKESAEGHRGLSHRRARWPRRTMRPLRPSHDRVLFLPQSPLPKVPERRPRGVARTTRWRAAALRVLSGGLHAAADGRALGPPEPTDCLRHALSRRGRDPLANRRRSQTSGREDRLRGGAPYLGTESASSSAPPLRRSRWRHRSRPFTLDCLSPAVSFAREGAQSALPRQVCRLPATSFSSRRAKLPWPVAAACAKAQFHRLAKPDCPKRVGGLRQTALWWTAPGPEVSGPLYPSRGDLQPAPGCASGRSRELSLEELYASRPALDHDAAGDRVHSALSAPRVTRGFVKIRHFGFLANRGREDNIRLCRTLLDAQSPNVRDAAVTRQPQPNPPDRCPLCNEGSMRPVEIILPQASVLARAPIPVAALRCDSS